MKKELVLSVKLGEGDEAWEQEFKFRRPVRPEMKLFFDLSMESIYEASSQLQTTTLVSPSRDDYLRLVEEYPGLVMALAAKMQDFLGASVQVTVKN